MMQEYFRVLKTGVFFLNYKGHNVQVVENMSISKSNRDIVYIP